LPEPNLVVLDEPFASLDPRSQLWLKEHLQHMNEERGTTMLISSHDLGHVTEVCTRIVILEAGEIVRDAVVEGGFAVPADLPGQVDEQQALLQELVRRYGELLTHWSTTTKAIAELRKEGTRLAQQW